MRIAYATMVAVTYAFDVADPVRITLFAAGAALEGALLAPDPQPGVRVSRVWVLMGAITGYITGAGYIVGFAWSLALSTH